jgi:hypothetical protein
MAPNTYEYGVKYREDNKEELKEYDAEKYLKNREIILQREKDRYAANPEAKKAYDKEFRKTDAGKKISRKAAWKKRGVIFETKEEFESVYKIYLETEFCNFCNCKLHEGNVGCGKKTLDHDHATGKFRNILCNKCNISRR